MTVQRRLDVALYARTYQSLHLRVINYRKYRVPRCGPRPDKVFLSPLARNYLDFTGLASTTSATRWRKEIQLEDSGFLIPASYWNRWISQVEWEYARRFQVSYFSRFDRETSIDSCLLMFNQLTAFREYWHVWSFKCKAARHKIFDSFLPPSVTISYESTAKIDLSLFAQHANCWASRICDAGCGRVDRGSQLFEIFLKGYRIQDFATKFNWS